MIYKSFKFQLIARVIVLMVTMFLFTTLYNSDTYFFTKFLVFLAVLVQGYYLYNYVEKSNREITHFLESIHYDDFTNTYPEKKNSSSQASLYHEFNEILKKFREIRADKEAQHQYLRTIVQHIGIGIITFDQLGEVQIINNAAKKLLDVKLIKNINQIGKTFPTLLESFSDLKTGGRDLVKISKNGDEIQLAIYAIELSLLGKAFKLVSIQNIQSELEEKEMEAWQNLIRVLTHEIMNSVTPISSLAATVETELDEFQQSGADVAELRTDQIEDFYLSVKTIHNRSESLIKFVSDFRNMTRIKLPALEEVKITDIIDHVTMLLKPDFEKYSIETNISIKPDLSVMLDKEQIEQVIINVVKNAVQALAAGEKDSKALTITAMNGESGGTSISIVDNGVGIEEDALKKIFIPFFTTKKNGSGIGLSLSKQIMRNHGGSISAQSEMGEGTEFILKFPG
ncbi:MAG: ATP-binding protein [Cyclobacteriaceae bacterium]